MKILPLDLGNSTEIISSENKLEISLSTETPLILDPNHTYTARFVTLNFDDSKVAGWITWDLADTGPECVAGVLDRRSTITIPLKPRLTQIELIRITLNWRSGTRRGIEAQLLNLILFLIIEDGGRDHNSCVGW